MNKKNPTELYYLKNQRNLNIFWNGFFASYILPFLNNTTIGTYSL